MKTYAAQGLGQMLLWKISTDREEFEKLTKRRYVDVEELHAEILTHAGCTQMHEHNGERFTCLDCILYNSGYRKEVHK